MECICGGSPYIMAGRENVVLCDRCDRMMFLRPCPICGEEEYGTEEPYCDECEDVIHHVLDLEDMRRAGMRAGTIEEDIMSLFGVTAEKTSMIKSLIWD